jgi:hypothetical protein
LGRKAITCSVQACDRSAGDLILHFGVIVAVEEILVLQEYNAAQSAQRGLHPAYCHVQLCFDLLVRMRHNYRTNAAE